MASELLKRSEVKEADTWNVKDMYPTTEAWENELKVITGLSIKLLRMKAMLPRLLKIS